MKIVRAVYEIIGSLTITNKGNLIGPTLTATGVQKQKTVYRDGMRTRVGYMQAWYGRINYYNFSYSISRN